MADINVNNNYTDMKNLTPFKLCVLQNFPFIEADFDAVTNYQLLCKVVEYLNKVIDNNNKQNNNITQLDQNFITLYNYVKNYFDNLDVQNEINNKLDEMAASGELTILIKNAIPILTPEIYGAKGDGVTDDSDAIQDMFDEVNSGQIILMSKKYLVSKTIILPKKSDVTIIGGTLIASNEMNELMLEQSHDSVESSSGWNVASENLIINNLTLYSNYNSNCIQLHSSLRIQFNGCHFYYFKDFAIETGGIDSHEVYIINSSFIGRKHTDNESNAYGIIISSSDCKVINCVFSFLHYSLYFKKGGTFVRNCHMYSNDNNGGNLLIDAVSNLNFSDCYFDTGKITINTAFECTFNNCYFLIVDSPFNLIGINNTGISYFKLISCTAYDARINKDSNINFFTYNYIINRSYSINNVLDISLYSNTIDLNDEYYIFNLGKCDIAYIGNPVECHIDNNTSSIVSTTENSEYTIINNTNYLNIKYNGSETTYLWLLVDIYITDLTLFKIISLSGAQPKIYDENNNYLYDSIYSIKKAGRYKIAFLRDCEVVLSSN